MLDKSHCIDCLRNNDGQILTANSWIQKAQAQRELLYTSVVAS